MNYYILKLSHDELVDLINRLIKAAEARNWDGKMPAIEGQINYITSYLNENGKLIIQAKKVVGEYAVFDIGEFEADDYSISLLQWGKPYLSLDTELHEYLACRFGNNYVEDYYEHENEKLVKENIRLSILAGNSRK